MSITERLKNLFSRSTKEAECPYIEQHNKDMAKVHARDHAFVAKPAKSQVPFSSYRECRDFQNNLEC